jgi:hypothetical protein
MDQGPFARPVVNVDAVLSRERAAIVVCHGLSLRPLSHKRAYRGYLLGGQAVARPALTIRALGGLGDPSSHPPPVVIIAIALPSLRLLPLLPRFPLPLRCRRVAIAPSHRLLPFITVAVVLQSRCCVSVVAAAVTVAITADTTVCLF